MSSWLELPGDEEVRVVGEPVPGTREVRFGMAELRADAYRPNAWLLTVDGIAQSYVDLDDPTFLELDYVRFMGCVVDSLEPFDAALDVVHIGGGGGTFPRYLSALRPGSRHLIIEADGALAEFVDERLGLRSVPGVELRIGDGLSEIHTLSAASAHLVVADAFEGLRMAEGITGAAFTAQVARVLRTDGVYLLNLVGTRHQLDEIRAAFPHHALLDGDVFAGYVGNQVLAASRVPLPLETLYRQAEAAFPPVRVTVPDRPR
ncbi:fused MFS/spermidine synthase [Nocardia sp. NBC_01503]|uniref:spermidine synthase n=1 Tax=Nocardia sp. NBC_01503 TaxID=2975997 RepID=UPI002E7C0D96|nr:fused MFS/spermidine synthase [Nocardia sp. NBC_01503]WTL32061.1 fused MFS/spermidine synthase [Nocardia sp. NBC_01503]